MLKLLNRRFDRKWLSGQRCYGSQRCNCFCTIISHLTITSPQGRHRIVLSSLVPGNSKHASRICWVKSIFLCFELSNTFCLLRAQAFFSGVVSMFVFPSWAVICFSSGLTPSSSLCFSRVSHPKTSCVLTTVQRMLLQEKEGFTGNDVSILNEERLDRRLKVVYD